MMTETIQSSVSGPRERRASMGSLDMNFLLEKLDLMLKGEIHWEEIIKVYERAANEFKITRDFQKKGIDIVMALLLRRLREATIDSLLAGRKRSWQELYVGDLEKAVADVRRAADTYCSTKAMQNSELEQSEDLLLQLQCMQIAKSKSPGECLVVLKRKLAGESISIGVIVDVLRALSAEVKREIDEGETLGPNTITLLSAGIIQTVLDLLLGIIQPIGRPRIPILSRFNAGAQLFAYKLLGYLCCAISNDSIHEKEMSKKLSVFMGPVVKTPPVVNSMASSKLSKNKIVMQQRNLIIQILMLFETNSRCQEHASIWSILKMLKEVCKIPSLCEQFLVHGLIAQLNTATNIYMELDELGDPVYSDLSRDSSHYTQWKDKLETKTKPAFPRFVRSPVLPGPLQAGKSTKSSLTFGQSLFSEEQQERRSTETLPPLTPEAKKDKTKYMLASEALKSVEFDPNLNNYLYLFGEPLEDNLNDFKKVCDRNMILLMIKDVRNTCKITRDSMVSVFKKTDDKSIKFSDLKKFF